MGFIEPFNVAFLYDLLKSPINDIFNKLCIS